MTFPTFEKFRVLLHIIVQEYVLGIGDFLRHKGGVGGEELESHKHESAEYGGAVRAALQDADDAVAAAESLLCEVQKQHEALLAARLQDSRHTQVDSASLNHSFPARDGVLGEEDLEVHLHGLLVLAL